MNNTYGLTKSDLNILERMYLYGRGYGTDVLLRNFFDVSGQYLRKRLKILKDKKLLKVFRIQNCYLYAMNSKSLGLFKRDDYLVRMKLRNESKEVIQDKLSMLNFIRQYRSKGFKFISSFDKAAVLKKLYGFSDADLTEFRVRASEEIFFNDVMFAPEDNLSGELCIALFPREKVYPATYLRDFLIKQYFRLNYKIIAQGKKVKFLIMLDNEYRTNRFETEILRKNVFKSLSKIRLEPEVIEHYNFNSTIRQNFTADDMQKLEAMKLNDVPISLTYFDVQAVYLPYPHVKLK